MGSTTHIESIKRRARYFFIFLAALAGLLFLVVITFTSLLVLGNDPSLELLAGDGAVVVMLVAVLVPLGRCWNCQNSCDFVLYYLGENDKAALAATIKESPCLKGWTAGDLMRGGGT